jgi:predicted nucleic acid-binding protein
MLEDLRENIQREIQVVSPQVLAATFKNMQHHVQMCLDAQGGHFQHML